MKNSVVKIYDDLFSYFGPQNWWPADTVDETIMGAILTQNVAWSNVEKALKELKKTKLLTLDSLLTVSSNELADLILSARYSRQKAVYLQEIARYLKEWNYDYSKVIKSFDLPELRKNILMVKGVGNETADTILLYAFKLAFFVIDAYTQRLAFRLGLVKEEKEKYLKLQIFFQDRVPKDVNLYNEFHALIVRLCKEFCTKRKPLCLDCPLLKSCKYGGLHEKSIIDGPPGSR